MKLAEAYLKSAKIDLEKLKPEIYSSAYFFLDELKKNKVKFEYDVDKEKGFIVLNNMNNVEFSVDSEGVYMDGLFKGFSFKGATTTMVVVKKILELDTLAGKAR